MQPIFLNTPEYTVEVWDINGVYVMDISDIIATSLSIKMEVNNVEDISFALDLVQFEERCRAVGSHPRSILEPYRSEIRIRRNGNYLCGGQVVQLNINYNQQELNKIIVKCTGYLNFFKDRYISTVYRDMTYAQIARQLVTDLQSVPNLIANGQFYDDTSGWMASGSGYIAWDPDNGYNYKGCLYTSNTTGPNSVGGARYLMTLKAGVSYTATFNAKATKTGGTIFAWTPDYSDIFNITDTNWHTYTTTWTQTQDSYFIDFVTSATTNFYLDDVKVTSSLDKPEYYSFGITLGVDYASPLQQDDRQRTYDLQNGKDGIYNLTKLENDNFDIQFTADKVMNIYARLGSDKPEIELVYPQNITSIQVTRDASTLANRVIALGSGIGSERLTSIATGYESALAYRIRERTDTFNSVIQQPTLDAHAFGRLNEYQDIYEVPAITVEANHLNLDEVQLGDAINVRIDGSTFVTTIDGMYRIMGMNINVDRDMNESISLDMEKW